MATVKLFTMVVILALDSKVTVIMKQLAQGYRI
jgi:hypothetical protein